MCEFGEAGKRTVEEEDDDATDRLSHLPDFIIHNILSFLDTKSVVQTSVLSRSWSSTWKHVPVFDLRRDSFQHYSSFLSCVDKVLSLHHPLNARKVSYTDDESSEDRDPDLLIRLIQAAASGQTTQHLVISLKDYGDHRVFRFFELFGSILNSNFETLELNGVPLDRGYESTGFRLLTRLHLDNCLMVCTFKGDLDPFSEFPCLENLVLSDCTSCGILRVSGPNLLSLKLGRMCPDIEVFAPKLRFFSLWNDWTLLHFSSLSLPSLDHAHIQFHVCGIKDDWVERALIVLFQGLHNVKSLKLHPWTIQVLSELYEFLEQQPCPFTRLELLIVEADGNSFSTGRLLFQRNYC